LQDCGVSAFLENLVLIESLGVFSNFGAEKPLLFEVAVTQPILHPHKTQKTTSKIQIYKRVLLQQNSF
jgi:hypothetical protein